MDIDWSLGINPGQGSCVLAQSLKASLIPPCPRRNMDWDAGMEKEVTVTLRGSGNKSGTDGKNMEISPEILVNFGISRWEFPKSSAPHKALIPKSMKSAS